MAVTQVQDIDVSNGSSATSHDLAFGSNVTAGNTLIVAVRTNFEDVSVTGVTDTLGNTWSLVQRQAQGTGSGGQSISLWKTENISSGGANTITVTYDAATSGTQFWLAEFSGSSPVVEDQKDGGENTGVTTSHDCGTITTTLADSVVILAACVKTAYTISTGPSGYTRQDSGLSRSFVYTKIVSSTGTETPTFDTAASENTAIVLCNLGYGAGGGGGNPLYYLKQQQLCI